MECGLLEGEGALQVNMQVHHPRATLDQVKQRECEMAIEEAVGNYTGCGVREESVKNDSWIASAQVTE